MNQNPEQIAKDKIDRQLADVGWVIQSRKKTPMSEAGSLKNPYQFVILLKTPLSNLILLLLMSATAQFIIFGGRCLIIMMRFLLVSPPHPTKEHLAFWS